MRPTPFELVADVFRYMFYLNIETFSCVVVKERFPVLVASGHGHHVRLVRFAAFCQDTYSMSMVGVKFDPGYWNVFASGVSKGLDARFYVFYIFGFGLGAS